jgi:hypothetical protein
MSKQYNKLWGTLVSYENLWLAYKKAAKGKSGKPAAFSRIEILKWSCASGR